MSRENGSSIVYACAIHVLNLGIGILQGALAGDRRAGAPRPPTGHRPRNPVKFDTRHNSFGVLSANRWRIFGSVFCVQHREINHVKPDHAPMPAITEAVSS
jgi:hypothetical protein